MILQFIFRGLSRYFSNKLRIYDISITPNNSMLQEICLVKYSTTSRLWKPVQSCIRTILKQFSMGLITWSNRGLNFPIIVMTPLSELRNSELCENFEQVMDGQCYPLLNNKMQKRR